MDRASMAGSWKGYAVSGGFYCYPHLKEVFELTLSSEFRQMADRLTEMFPASLAAQNTNTFIAMSNVFLNSLESMASEELREVWKQIDLYASGDIGKEYLQKAVEEFEE